MSRLAIVTMTLCCSLWAQGDGGVRPQPGEAPRLKIHGDVWDFGKAPQHTKLEHEFKISNAGGGVLEILAVRPTCACNAALPKKTRLEAGEATVIKASMETKTFKGPITKAITVKTNDPARSVQRLTVKGEVMPPFWVSPAEINLGALSKGRGTAGREFRFVIAPGSELEIQSVEATSPNVVIERLNEEPDERIDGAREIRYRVGVKPGLPVGMVRERVVIHTNVRTQRSASVGVNAEVKGEVHVMPRTFNLGRVKQGEETSREITITKSGDADLVIEGLEIRPADKADIFDAEVTPVEDGRVYKIQVGVRKDAPARYHRARLVIRTNCAGEEVHQAYFYVFVRRG